MKRTTDEKPSTILDKAGKTISKRQTALFFVCTVLLGALLLRLFYLQVIRNKYYEDKVIEQMIYQTPISAPRGDITDRNGRVLATTYKTERVYFSPSDIKSDDERRAACEYLAEKLENLRRFADGPVTEGRAGYILRVTRLRTAADGAWIPAGE